MGIKENLPLEVKRAITALGDNIRAARVRRRMNQDDLANACQISRKTLYALETGEPGVSVATAFTALWALGLLDSAGSLADPDKDEHGKTLEAARRPRRVRPVAQDDVDF